MRSSILLGMLLAACGTGPACGEDLFVDQVAPLLQRRCLSCHNGENAKGGLSLATAARLRRGGESGESIQPGKSGESLLMDYISGDDPEMPKNGAPLNAHEVALIARWIDAGAVWPDGFELQLPDARDWWSLQPLKRPPLPSLSASQTALADTPIDAFVLRKLEDEQLSLSPPADRRTMVRRLSFDLLGLPPTPREVRDFLADRRPQAYQHLVDRMLASPRYGERWARHWLDVVHYADTHGYDKDKLRENAWPYRDYVVRSFNQDKPYARFIQQQVAGDRLFPGSPEAIEALGFIAAGPWDFVGHAEVPESKLDGQIARHLDRDDMVGAVMKTFVSMTAQCARCHDHKFDPISQEDYYSLQAVFAALDRADRTYDADPQVAARRLRLEERRSRLEQEQARLEAAVRQQGGSELKALEARIAEQRAMAQAGPRAEFGYHSQIAARPDTLKWVQVDLGKSQRLESIEYVGCHDDFNNIGSGFGFPRRYKIEASDDPSFAKGVIVLEDCTAADVANPGVTPQVLPVESVPARYVRFTATRLAERKNDYIFALAELRVKTSDQENAAAGVPVTALDSIEAPVRWRRQNLVDGYHCGIGQDPAAGRALRQLQSEREAVIAQRVSAATRQRLDEVARQRNETAAELKKLPAQRRVFAGTIHHGQGAFMGRGHVGGTPRTIHVLHRGDMRNKGPEVGPGTVDIIPEVAARFALPPEHSEADRRAALAAWLTRRDHPLTWRSIANRVWQYHFGRGLVDSPNDFGRMGQQPTHPELLDWLAVEVRDQGGSLKRLHRWIVTSRVYRQSSADRPEMAQRDRQNRFLWRMNRRRLEAEAIHDAALQVAGRLRNEMYGPGFRSFLIEKPEHSPHYQYHKYDPRDPATHRRSVYRFVVRSQPDPFLESLDCADPSLQVAKRGETLTALQALTLLNNRFMLQATEYFAERLEQTHPDLPAQVRQGFLLTTGRDPKPQELQPLVAFARKHGLPHTCRVLLNTNEFVFID